MTQTRVEPAASPERPAVAPRFPCFDGLRALAALAVFAFHSFGVTYARGMFTAPHWLLNWLSRLGLFGVAVFFVISGFLLYRPFAVAALTDHPDPRWFPFWKRRFFRIYPAYWVVLAVSVFLLGQNTFGSIQEGIFHFGLLQNYRAGYLREGVGVSWTLVIEISFYIALPFIAAALRAPSRRSADLDARLRVQLIGLT